MVVRIDDRIRIICGEMHCFIDARSTVQSVLLQIKQRIANEEDSFLIRL